MRTKKHKPSRQDEAHYQKILRRVSKWPKAKRQQGFAFMRSRYVREEPLI